MTIPSVLNHAKETQLKTGLKKAQSVLSEALQLMQEEEGIIPNYANYRNGGFLPVFRKYLSYIHDCTSTACASTGTYKTYNKNTEVPTQDFSSGQLILSDGMLLLIGDRTGYIYLSVDVNGVSNKPNLYGHDLFTFITAPDTGKLIPLGHPDYNIGFGSAANACSKTSTSAFNGQTCAYLALTEDDYFKNLP